MGFLYLGTLDPTLLISLHPQFSEIHPWVMKTRQTCLSSILASGHVTEWDIRPYISVIIREAFNLISELWVDLILSKSYQYHRTSSLNINISLTFPRKDLNYVLFLILKNSWELFQWIYSHHGFQFLFLFLINLITVIKHKPENKPVKVVILMKDAVIF